MVRACILLPQTGEGVSAVGTTVGAVRAAEEGASDGIGIGSSGSGVRVIGCGDGQGGVSEEAVEEEGGFEDEVREAGEEVPDVEEAEVARGGGREEAAGGEVGG